MVDAEDVSRDVMTYFIGERKGKTEVMRMQGNSNNVWPFDSLQSKVPQDLMVTHP